MEWHPRSLKMEGAIKLQCGKSTAGLVPLLHTLLLAGERGVNQSAEQNKAFLSTAYVWTQNTISFAICLLAGRAGRNDETKHGKVGRRIIWPRIEMYDRDTANSRHRICKPQCSQLLVFAHALENYSLGQVTLDRSSKRVCS